MTITSEFECVQSLFYELPRDGYILSDILEYTKIPSLEIIKPDEYL